MNPNVKNILKSAVNKMRGNPSAAHEAAQKAWAARRGHHDRPGHRCPRRHVCRGDARGPADGDDLRL